MANMNRTTTETNKNISSPAVGARAGQRGLTDATGLEDIENEDGDLEATDDMEDLEGVELEADEIDIDEEDADLEADDDLEDDEDVLSTSATDIERPAASDKDAKKTKSKGSCGC